MCKWFPYKKNKTNRTVIAISTSVIQLSWVNVIHKSINTYLSYNRSEQFVMVYGL